MERSLVERDAHPAAGVAVHVCEHPPTVELEHPDREGPREPRSDEPPAADGAHGMLQPT
jgi:hypothetical protein